MFNNDVMGFTINDNELLNMPESLRSQLLDFLKEQRNNSEKNDSAFIESKAINNVFNNKLESEDDGLKVIRSFTLEKVNALQKSQETDKVIKKNPKKDKKPTDDKKPTAEKKMEKK